MKKLVIFIQVYEPDILESYLSHAELQTTEGWDAKDDSIPACKLWCIGNGRFSFK